MREIIRASWPGIDKSRILRAVNSVLLKSKAVREVGLVFVSPQKMHQLNKKYRGQDKSTSVLSFEEGPSSELGAGDVVVCPDVAREEARRYGFTQKNWMTRLVVHGILHLAGYDHDSRVGASKMESVENKVLARLGLVPKLKSKN